MPFISIDDKGALIPSLATKSNLADESKLAPSRRSSFSRASRCVTFQDNDPESLTRQPNCNTVSSSTIAHVKIQLDHHTS